MLDVGTHEAVGFAVAFLVPGAIVLFVRSRFLTGRMPSVSDHALAYICTTLIYAALLLPFVPWLFPTGNGVLQPSLAWFAYTFIGPAVLGFGLGLWARLGRLPDFLRKWLRLTGRHAIATAWDWQFLRQVDPCWIHVTLKNGDHYRGWYGSGSFASSDPEQRDLFLEKVYTLDEKDQWNPLGETAVYIGPGEIQTIEFITRKDKP